MAEQMTPDEFKSIGELLWGVQWKNKMARAIHKDRGTIYRYCGGEIEICAILSMLLRAWVEKFQKTGELPKV